ncbi:MAG TPA: M28 family peptidase [Vicinamibacterales bacterium]
MKKVASLLAAIALASACGAATAGAPATPRADRPIPPGAERAYRAVTGRFDRQSAMEIVTFMDRYWRLAANPGFNASIDHIRERLAAAGYGGANGTGTLRVDEFTGGARGWDYTAGTLAFEEGSDPILLSRERDRVSLAINSFSTPADGVRAPLIDVGAGTESDYAGKEVRGAVVLGDASIGRLWQEAVKKRGAIGVVSTEIARYIRPSNPSEMSEPQKDVLQWGGIPYDATVKGFGFKSSWRAANRMRERLKAGPVNVRVQIDSSFYEGPTRTLVAEIPGRLKPAERIVLVAHVQEPGANDDASGCATLYGLARALSEAIASGALPRPDRTLTFLWVDEVRGSRQWITSRPEEARGVQYMMAMDMTGEDTAKTGGTFLVEKQADPSAVWARPSDPHTEWGGGDVKESSLKGSLLNDVHLAIAARRASDTGWIVRTNPYEGGSDHTAFAGAGVPSLLNWHFTDRFYHSSQDRPDKTSAAEMENVGVAVAASAWFLASADATDAAAVVDLLSAAAARRLALEREQGAKLVAAAANRAEAEATESKVIAAWLKWYGEALDTVLTLPAGGADDALRAKVAAAKRQLR